jgi:hypothetical protein
VEGRYLTAAYPSSPEESTVCEHWFFLRSVLSANHEQVSAWLSTR